jgi:uncharacterized membrane protein (TIGR02234 family)
VPDVVGAAPHVAMIAAGWQTLEVAGALAMIVAGVLVLLNPSRLAVMSSRYEAPEGSAVPVGPRLRAGRSENEADQDDMSEPADSASIWEALSRGDDPTADSRQAAGT